MNREIFYMIVSVLMAFILVVITVVACVTVDNYYMDKEHHKNFKQFSSWYVTNMEAVED